MKRLYILAAIAILCQTAFSQKKYEMVVEKTDGKETVINVEDIVRTYFREKGNEDKPDDNTPSEIKAVDLGLSVKWANMNVGAKNPEDTGDYYAWGETATKKTYSDNNWQYDGYLAPESEYDIIGTEYDVAYKKLGNGWRMPLKSEFQEMVDKCTFVITTHNSVKVAKITGPNGNSIILPLGGYFENRNIMQKGQGGFYWSGTIEFKHAKCFSVDVIMWADYWLNNAFGALVRAVHE